MMLQKEGVANKELQCSILVLEVTRKCNLRCSYCYIGDNKINVSMSEDIAGQAILILLNNAKNKNFKPSLYFIGGEPIININLIKFCITRCRELQNKGFPEVNFSITTNGILLNDKIVSFLRENKVEICISLDGKKDKNDFHRKTSKGEGSYDKIINGIKLLTIKNKPEKQTERFSVRATITNHTKDVHETIEHFCKLNIPCYRIFPAVPSSEENIFLKKEDIDQVVESQIVFFKKQVLEGIQIKDIVLYNCLVNILLDIKTEFSCGACRDYLGVDVYGNIVPCHRFFGRQEYILGNIEEGILNNKLIDFFNVKVQDRDGCKNCDIKFLCGGPCYFDWMIVAGDMKIMNQFSCQFSKKLYTSVRDFSEELKRYHFYIIEKILNVTIKELKRRGVELYKKSNSPLFEWVNKKANMTTLKIIFLIYRKSAECIDIDEEGILYKKGDFTKKYILNVTAMAIWDLIDGQRTAQQIAQEIANVCEVEFDTIKDDIYGQLAAFQELGLVEEVQAENHA